MEIIQEGLLWICLTIDSFIYNLIMFVYRIILVLARVNIFEDTTVLDNFVNRIYVIIGVVMLFLLAYSLLKSMINPDDAFKGKNPPQKIIFNVIISVVLIALVPSIFSIAAGFQNAILQQGTLNSIILGTENTTSTAEDINDGGFYMAAGVFQAFFHPLVNEENYCQYFVTSNLSSGCNELEVMNGAFSYSEFWQQMRDNGSFSMLPELNEDILRKIDYTWLISSAAGIFVLLVLISYCIDIAIRSIKLAVFQLIAPVPILARLVPNEQGNKVFSNWIKACLSTYLEVFIRLAILFFVILIITALQDNIGNIFAPFTQGGGIVIGFLAWAFLIIGLILFMKQLPQIIKDITGLDSGKYNVFGSAFKAAAMLGGGVTAAVRNWNAKNPDGSQRRVRDRLRSAAGGFGSAAIRSTMHRDDVKGFKDVRQNAHNSAEEAIKKRIARENSKRERDAYFQSEGEPTMEDRNILGKAAGAVKYKAHGLNIMRKEWAGEAAVDPITLTRTKEFADKIDSGFAAIEGTWKKTQAFIDAKAETEKLSKQESAMKTQYNELINQGLTSEQASARLVSSWGVSLNEISEKAANAKAIQTEIERSEQKKKAESIATAARNIQLSVAQYSDIKLDQNAILAREDNEGKRQQMQAALQKYGNLDNNVNFQQLIKDLQSSDHEVQDMARSLLDYYDKMNLEAKAKKGEAAYQEEMRKSTLNSKPSDGGKK